MPRFAANLTMMFNEWDFLDRFTAAADAGFYAVEYLFPYDFDADEIAVMLDRNKLTQALFNLPPGDWSKGDRGMAAIPGRGQEFKESVEQALRYAQATGVKRLHAMAGIANFDDPACQQIYRANIGYAAGVLADHGIDLLLEPINGRDMPGYFMDSFHKAAAIIADAQLPNLKLQFDIYHRQILHGDVMKGLESLIGLTGHIQIASVPDRNEPATGELDDMRLFSKLDVLAYSGFVGCEYRPKGKTIDGLGWMTKVRACASTV